MTSKKNTRRALFVSVMSLILCCAMLMGTTFAWFTDSVTSESNIIKSGNLDVEMYWANGTKAVPTEDSGWTDASKGAIFNYDKWEPGYTEVRHIKIENKGTLALKYHINIDATDEVSDLANVIDVYFIDPAVQVTSRDGLSTEYRVGTLKQILDGMPANTAGILKEDETATVTIALKMQEQAGNEYMGKAIGSEFAVILNATQLVEEEDSFGNDYDEGLILPEVDEELLFEKDGIQYYYDENDNNVLYLVTEEYKEETLVVPEGVTDIGNYAFSYNSNVKEVILSSTVRDLGRGFDSSAVEKVVLNEGLETISSRAFRSTTALDEVVFSSTVKVIEDNAFQKSGIKSIVIPASVETIGETAFGSSQIESVTFEGNTSIQGYAFRGCKNLRTVVLNGENVEFIPSTLNGRNSTWFCNGESNNPNTSDIDFYVANATVADRVKTAMGAEANNTDVIVLVADGLRTDANGNYYVYNAAGLQSLNSVFTNGAYGHAIWGKTYNIMADINAEGIIWNTVNLNTPNNGCVGFTINGNGHTISGLNISGNGLFTSTANGKDTDVPATFKNLTFDKVTVNSGYHVGILWGQMYGDILVENVHVKNSTVTGTCNVGAFVGRNGDEGASTATYKNCSVYDTTITATGNGDPNGASVFQGSALTSNSGISVKITIENCEYSGNTLTSAADQVGGGIYACWNASTGVTSVVND